MRPVPPRCRSARCVVRAGGTDLDRAERILAQKKSVLDAVLDDYGSLSRELGADDRRKLDAHLSSIRELDRRISR